jgi:hypothetical protein
MIYIINFGRVKILNLFQNPYSELGSIGTTVHDEIERINEEIRELKNEIKKNKINNWPTNSGKRIVTKVKRK